MSWNALAPSSRQLFTYCYINDLGYCTVMRFISLLKALKRKSNAEITLLTWRLCEINGSEGDVFLLPSRSLRPICAIQVVLCLCVSHVCFHLWKMVVLKTDQSKWIVSSLPVHMVGKKNWREEVDAGEEWMGAIESSYTPMPAVLPSPLRGR